MGDAAEDELAEGEAVLESLPEVDVAEAPMLVEVSPKTCGA